MLSTRTGLAPTPAEWIDRCSACLMGIDPNSPLDGTDWDDIAADLWEAQGDGTPEAAALDWHRQALR